MKIVVVIASLAFFLFWLLFGALIFPIWMIINCARDSERSTESKIPWVVIMILVFPFGAYLYGLFASGRRAIIMLSLSVVLTWVLAIGGAYFGLRFLQNRSLESVPQLRNLIEQSSSYSLPQRGDLLRAIDILEQELRVDWPLSDNARNDVELFDQLERMLGDKKLEEKEAQVWLGFFDKRRDIDASLFDDALEKEFKSKGIA
jgi:hypothetical protein